MAFSKKAPIELDEKALTVFETLLALMIAFQVEEWTTVWTDQNCLWHLCTQSSLNDRQWRWLASLSEYHYDLEYKAWSMGQGRTCRSLTGSA